MEVSVIKEESVLTRFKHQFHVARIQHWYRSKRRDWYATHDKPRSFYVLKSYKDGRKKLRLSNEEIVIEHIGSVLYRLLGIKTPEIRIIPELQENKIVCSIASQYLEGYKDLFKILSEHDENLLFKLDEAVTKPSEKKPKVLASAQKRRNEIFKACYEKANLHIDKEKLLIAAILLMEADVIGASFSNIGILLSDKEETLVKIDTGRVDLNSNIKDFKKSVSLKNPLIYNSFSTNFFNDPKMILIRNLHLNEFFQDVSMPKLKKNIKALGRIPDNEIKKHIIRPDYEKFVSRERLVGYAQNIIDRKNCLLEMIKAKSFFMTFSCFDSTEEEEIQKRILPLQTVFANREDFSEPVHTIVRGASSPQIVFKKSDESNIKQMNRFTIKNLGTT